jgi:hypothetical protein
MVQGDTGDLEIRLGDWAAHAAQRILDLAAASRDLPTNAQTVIVGRVSCIRHSHS